MRAGWVRRTPPWTRPSMSSVAPVRNRRGRRVGPPGPLGQPVVHIGPAPARGHEALHDVLVGHERGEPAMSPPAATSSPSIMSTQGWWHWSTSQGRACSGDWSNSKRSTVSATSSSGGSRAGSTRWSAATTISSADSRSRVRRPTWAGGVVRQAAHRQARRGRGRHPPAVRRGTPVTAVRANSAAAPAWASATVRSGNRSVRLAFPGPSMRQPFGRGDPGAGQAQPAAPGSRRTTPYRTGRRWSPAPRPGAAATAG